MSSCTRPIYAVDLGIKENGKRNIKILPRRADCYSWKLLTEKYGDKSIIPLPCGQCLNCRLSKAKEWAVRCVLESLYHDDNWFVTLTYDDEHLPKDQKLCKKHYQDFFKRLRKVVGSFRYFGCGEYGSLNKRPHYHFILFGCKLDDLKSIGSNLFESDLLNKLWPYGFNTIGEVNYSSCNYVARYTTKKVFGDKSDEFLAMSTKPGLGYQWFLDHKDSVIQYDSVFGKFGNSKAVSVPRYFDKIGELLDGDRYSDLKAARLDSSKLFTFNTLIGHGLEKMEDLYDYRDRCSINDFVSQKKGSRL